MYTFRMLASREGRETSVALTSTLHWFETDVLAEERNYQGLARLNTALIQHTWRPVQRTNVRPNPFGGSSLVAEGHAAKRKREVQSHYRTNPVRDPNPCF